jgi:hypothetical protein
LVALPSGADDESDDNHGDNGETNSRRNADHPRAREPLATVGGCCSRDGFRDPHLLAFGPRSLLLTAYAFRQFLETLGLRMSLRRVPELLGASELFVKRRFASLGFGTPLLLFLSY